MNGLNRLDQPTINGLQSLELDTITTNTINSSLMKIIDIEGDTITVDSRLILLSGATVIAAGLEIQPSELSRLDGVTQNIEARFVADEGLINVNGGNIGTLQDTVESHEVRLDNDNVAIGTLQTQMDTVTPLIPKCQNISATSGITTFGGSIRTLSVQYLSDNTIQSTAFTAFHNTLINLHTSQIGLIQNQTQLLTSTSSVADFHGGLSCDTFVTRAAINFPDGTSQTTAYQTNTRVSMNYSNSSNAIWGLASTLAYNSVYNSTNAFLSSSIPNNSVITNGKLTKPGRYMITLNVQITDTKWITTILSRIWIINQPSNSTRYLGVMQGRNMGGSTQLSAENNFYYSAHSIFDVASANDTSFAIYNEFNFASSISGTRTVLSGEIAVVEL